MLLFKVSLSFLVGLFMLLKGLQLMKRGLQKNNGRSIKRILCSMTSNIYLGIFTGTMISSIVQSSGLLTIIVISFVDAGLMNLRQGIGLILGANIGTTVTAQILAFQVHNSILIVFFGAGGLLLLWKRKKVFQYAGRIILGLGLIFAGINIMAISMSPLHNCPFILDLLASLGHCPLLGICLGTIFTAIIQSSSAATGIIIALATQDLVNLPAAISFILGSNMGSCVTALLASIGTSLAARQVALAHLFLNILGVVVLFPFLTWFDSLVAHTALSIPRQIANAHTIFNIYNTIIVLPFLDILIKLITNLSTTKK